MQLLKLIIFPTKLTPQQSCAGVTKSRWIFQACKRETYKWLTREYSCSQTFLKKDSTFTANSIEIDTLVRSIWQPIMNRAPSEPLPSWEQFHQNFAAFIPNCPPFSIPPLTLQEFRASIQRMSIHSASGLDHWSVRAVRSLPTVLLDKLCTFFNLVEQTGDWPTSFTVGYLSLIPKPESDNSPSSLRPLSILSVLYRAWASSRLKLLMQWQESWCHSSQSGFRSLRDCFDAWYPLALQVEQSLLSGTPLCGAFLDFEKAFDLVPLHEIILPLAKTLGLPDFLVNCLSNFYSRLLRFLKHPKGFGSCLTTNRGIVQGCPVSVVLLNLLVSIFLRFVEHSNSEIIPQAYADDVSASATSVDNLGAFLSQSGSFAKITGQRLKAAKCTVWCTSTALMNDLRHLKLGSTPLKVVSDVRYLGAQFGFHEGMPHDVGWQLKLDTFQQLVARVRFLPLAAEGKALVIACPMAKVFYGCELTTLKEDVLIKMRRQVISALWKGRSGRVPEVLMTLIFPGHKCDPVQVVAYRALCTLRSMCLKYPQLAITASANWTLHIQTPGNNIWGPIHTAFSALQTLSWSWLSDFSSFQTPNHVSISWLKCSRTWFQHQVRGAMRQSLLSIAAGRCAHLRDFSLLDKQSSVHLLRKLLQSDRPYMAGTLKAILANSIKTAVLFHKGGFVDCPICPFCEQNTPEDTTHMYEICPRWQPLRTEFLEHWNRAHLPDCTRFTGIACLPTSTVDEVSRLYQAPHPLDVVQRISYPVISIQPSTIVHIWIHVHGINLGYSVWKRWGFGFCTAASDPLNISVFDILSGPDQDRCRAFAVAFIHILKLIPCTVHLHVACPCAVSTWREATQDLWLPHKVDHVDIISYLRELFLARPMLDAVIFHKPPELPLSFRVAQGLAKQGAELHQTDAYVQAFRTYTQHYECVISRQTMMLNILLARDQYAQQNKLLTYSPRAKQVPFCHAPAATANVTDVDCRPEYVIHPNDFAGHCHVLGPFPSFSRSLRFTFGESFFHALVWYISQLKFPDVSIDSTKGVTFLELAMDFECASGIILPGSSQRNKKQDGSVHRRGGSMHVKFIQDPRQDLDQFLAHKITQNLDPNNKKRFECTVCCRSGAWADRNKFLKFSCAGKPETKSEAVRRQRIEQERKKQKCSIAQNDTPVPLGERSVVFGDAFRSILRHCKHEFLPLDHSTYVCRALKGHSLPPSAGLLVRPILLCQNTISDEISAAARCFHTGEWCDSHQWHMSWFPKYDSNRPDPLWRPREPD